MPTSVIAAVAGSLVADAVGAFVGSTIIGAIAGGLTSSVLNAAFTDSPDTEPAFEQELRDNLVTVRQPITHWQYIYGRARVAGAMTFAHQSADGNLHMVVTFAGHAVEDIETILFNDEPLTLAANGNATGKYGGGFDGYVRIKKSLGDEAGQPFPDLVAESEGKWTNDHRQSGRAKVYVRLLYHADLFPTGLPNITAIIKGRKVYDPRTGLPTWSDNPSLCIADFLCDTAAGLGCVYADEIDEAQLIASANIDDEAVALAGGGTEPRYTLNGAVTVNGPPRATIERMLTANAGKARYVGGVWRICSAAYVAPVITLTEDDLRAVPHVTPRLSAAELANRVKGLYVAEDNYWQPTDFPPITNATYLAEDNNEASWRELDLPYTKSAATAQRIAKIELEKMRQQISVEWPGKFTCYRLQPGDTVKVTFGLLGWSEKVFEVDKAGLALEADDGGIRLGADLVLREISATVYDWSSGEETVIDPAPDTDLPDPFTVGVPGTPEVAETLFETTGSAGVKARATVSWAAADDRYVIDYIPEYRLAAGTWTVLPSTTGLMAEINDIAPGDYEFRVRARNAAGVQSDYSGTRSKEILGLTAPPAAVAGFAVIKAGGFALASWSRASDLDVRIGGRIVIRHSPLTSAATWEDGIIVEEFGGAAVSGTVPLMTGTYLAKAVDSSGNYSTTAASVVAAEGMVTGWTTVNTSTQEPTFAGTKTNTVVVSNALQLDAGSLIDSMGAMIDTWDYLDSIGGVAAAGSYEFDAYEDMSTVATRRFEADIAANSFDAVDLIDSKAEPIDDWPPIDGGSIDDCDATLYAAITDDDPSGSPTWSDWMPFFVADFTCRAAKFKLDLSSGSTTHNIAVSTLAIDIKEPA